MKISSIQIARPIKNLAVALPLLITTPSYTQTNLCKDEFIKAEQVAKTGEIDVNITSREIKIADKIFLPKVVINLSDKKLYNYDDNTSTKEAFEAKFNRNFPPDLGLKIVSYISDYQDKAKGISQIICLSEVGQITGNTLPGTGLLIIGTNSPKSIDREFAQGNIIVDNATIQKLSESLSNGKCILIQE